MKIIIFVVVLLSILSMLESVKGVLSDRIPVSYFKLLSVSDLLDEYILELYTSSMI